METFTEPREFVENPRYTRDRQTALEALDLAVIDPPIVDLIRGFALLPQCYTLQSFYGHFVWTPGQDTHNLERLPEEYDGKIDYRIAYMAFCLENSKRGRALRDSLEIVPEIDPDYVQFGSAGWFWKRDSNTYVLQVEPSRYKTMDQVSIEHPEALRIESVRDLFFIRLEEVLSANPAS